MQMIYRSLKFIKNLGAVAAIAMVAGCGGAGGGAGGGSPDVLPPPGSLAFANGTAVIGVQAFNTGDPANSALAQLDGGVDGDGRLTVNDGAYAFIARSAFGSGVAIEQGDRVGLLTQDTLPGDRDIVIYDGFYTTDSGGTAVYYGLLGPELSGNLPATGLHTWTGIGFADLIDASGATESLGMGIAQVRADFGLGLGLGRVDVDIINLSGEGIDEVRLRDMQIADGRFTGGNIILRNNGAAVPPADLLGPSSVANEGFFSGDVTNNRPNEVGGVFARVGADATILGGFVAD